jgi:hypothetical protein
MKNVTMVTNEILWGKPAQENVSFNPKLGTSKHSLEREQ